MLRAYAGYVAHEVTNGKSRIAAPTQNPSDRGADSGTSKVSRDYTRSRDTVRFSCAGDHDVRGREKVTSNKPMPVGIHRLTERVICCAMTSRSGPFRGEGDFAFVYA